jgi:hypothetical protein
VVLDSSRREYAFLPATVYRALEHCGLPFRTLDLAWSPLDSADLSNSAAVLFAQEHVGASLRASDVSALLEAVDAGLGLVNLDFDLAGAPAGLAPELGLEADGPSVSFSFASLAGLGIRTDQHYITGTKNPGDLTRLRKPIAYARVRPTGDQLKVLVEAENGGPVLLAGRRGRGRVVQWTVSPRLWLREYLGFTQGLDDLFWKSIVWVARKPFLMKAMPPYVRMRFDDCNGHWRNAVDFAFLDHFVARGHRPNVSLNVRSITSDGAARVAELGRSGRADFAAHTLDAETSVWFKRRHGAYSAEEMRAIAREVDAAFARWGIEPSKVLSDHEHEFGHTALPYLQSRGIRYKMNINLPNEEREGLHRDWQPAPYGSMSYAFDEQPVSGMFVVFNHFPTFDHSRTYVNDGQQFFLNRTGGVGELKWDFLNGLTTSTRGAAGNDIKQAARRFAEHTARGFDSLFFGGSITHSHFIKDLAPTEWDDLLDDFERLTARYPKLYVSYDEIAEYAESKVNTHVESVELRPDGGLSCALRGEATLPLKLYCFVDHEDGATLPLKLYCFVDHEDGVEHSFREVPAFRGRQETILDGVS